MISRYALYNISDLRDRYNLTKGLPKGTKPHYNISPTKNAPVVLKQEEGRIVKLMKWGLVAKGSKDTNSVFRYKTYNIPSEKVFQRHSWSAAIRESRCLIPANGFYSLGTDKKKAHYIQPKDEPTLSFAGVFGSWQDPEGVTHSTFSIITTQAASGTPSSQGRTPVVIKPEDEERWLNQDIDDLNSLYDMLRPYPADLLEIREVDPAVHSPKLNRADLINPV